MAANADDTLFVAVTETSDSACLPLRIARRDIVIASGNGARKATTAQTDGPYYPVVEVSRYGNNLIGAADSRTALTPTPDGQATAEAAAGATACLAR